MKPSTTLVLKTSTIAVLLMLTACKAVGPNYERPEAKLPDTYGEATAQAQTEVQVNKDWWQLYQDATLNQLVETALVNNLDVQKAAARIEEAEAYAREIGAATLPQVNLDGSATKSRVTEAGAFPVFAANPRNNYSVKLGTQYEIDFWGKVSRAKESARAQLLSTEYAKDVTKLTIAGAVTDYYVNLRSAEHQIQITQDSIKNREENLALTQRRLAGGIVSGLDAHQAELSVSNLKAQLADLQRVRQLHLHQLSLLTADLGLALEAKPKLSLPVPPSPPVGLPSRLLEARPDIAQSEQTLVAANAQIGLAKAALFPSISLTANYGGESLALGDVLKSAARIWTAGLSLNLPIFDSGRLNAKVEQASAKQKQALIGYQQSIQTGFVEVNDALVSLRQYTEQEQALQRSELSAKQALAIAENRYKSGYVAYLDVLDAQRNYYDTQTNYVQTRANRLSASVALFKALGGGWQQPSAEKQP